ncbi:WDFY family member 4, partial [Paramuricea clavata]
MNENEGQSGSAEAVQETAHGESDAKPTQRARKFIEEGAEKRKRIEKEIIQIRKDFELARECHAEMYEYVGESQTSTMDEWEDILTNDVYDIEEMVETFLLSLSVSEHANPMSSTSEQILEPELVNSNIIEPAGGNAPVSHEEVEGASIHETEASGGAQSVTNSDKTVSNAENLQNIACNSVTDELDCPKSKINPNLSSPQSFDTWIDNLIEFEETVLPTKVSQMSIAEALYKLESSKDIPSIVLIKYDGNPLTYVEFIERFKLHIHDRPHLSDDLRMVQLKMHLIGNAERAISGLGSQGTMYATALKTLKEQFGQPSVIARAYINKLVEKRKLQGDDRQALQEFSFDVVNYVATLKQINHLADVNATDNLRKIVKRLPDHLIDKWKGVASDLREKGVTPSLQHISNFIRKRVKAEFDPDFGDIQKSDSRRFRPDRKGIHSGQRDPKKSGIQCYVCSEDHRVAECPTFSSCSNDDKIQHARDQRLCFSCLNRGHVTRDCKSKEKCGVKGCPRFHHCLLHVDFPSSPTTPPLSSATSALDKDSIMPVVRVRFKSANGRIREGNVLVDSGAGTTVIRTNFARAL